MIIKYVETQKHFILKYKGYKQIWNKQYPKRNTLKGEINLKMLLNEEKTPPEKRRISNCILASIKTKKHKTTHRAGKEKENKNKLINIKKIVQKKSIKEKDEERKKSSDSKKDKEDKKPANNETKNKEKIRKKKKITGKHKTIKTQKVKKKNSSTIKETKTKTRTKQKLITDYMDKETK